MERLLKVPQVVDRTGLSRSTVYELIARGELPSIAAGGTRTRRVREADLDEWIRRQAASGSAVATAA